MLRRPTLVTLTTTLATALAGGAAVAALVGPAEARPGLPAGQGACPPDAVALGYSDGLDKAVVDGVTVGGLSDIAYDARRHAYASTVDNHATDPSRIWWWRDNGQAHVVGGPLVLRAPDGTPYDGTTADDEGLAILPDGHLVVSSETEPSIRVFGRDGVQRAELPVPDRFRVAPAGEATANATLEGLTVTPNGRRIVAAMEGTLSGDVAADGTATYRRFVVYDHGRHGWRPTRQLGYQVDPGNRIAEVQAYGRDGLLVLEAAYQPATGNTIQLYAVHTRGAADVTEVADLGDEPAEIMPKTLVADVTACPSMGAPAKEAQANPLMDNFEGLTIGPVGSHHGRGGDRISTVTLISDDNFGVAQTTRVLRLAARLP
jgi:hypothetical protein